MRAVTEIRKTATRPAAESRPERLIDAETERLVLGNILAHGGGFWKLVGPQLELNHFAVESHRRVFSLIESVAENGGVPDLANCLRVTLDKGKTAEELGLPVLSDLAWNNQVDLVDPAPWVHALRRKAEERRAWSVTESLRIGIESGTALGEIESMREVLAGLEASYAAPVASSSTIADAVCSIGIDTLLAAPRGTIASPWGRLNEHSNGGLKTGELWLVGARTGVGKSTVCLQWALNAARAGHRVLFASLEMPQPDLLKRLLALEGNIPHRLLVRGDLESSWRHRVAETLDRIGEYPLEISDKLRSLSAIIAKVAATPGLGLLVVDYLGLVDPGGRFENRNQEVSSISRQLKLAALDYNIPILAAHQLNRANETENRRPQLSDLRDSGSLEQDADAVLLLDAPGTRKRTEEADREVVELHIAKQRNGARGYGVRLRLEGRFCRIIEDPAALAGDVA
jgi:replicative DNA helicase